MLWRKLYVSLVRPHLEYASPVWSPYHTGDKKTLEKVQHRLTRMARGLKRLQYNERCDRLSLTSLDSRRKRADLIQLYRILNGLDTLRLCNPPSFCTNINGPTTRGHNKRLKAEIFSSTIRNKFGSGVSAREHFFTNRVVPYWNDLPQSVVDATSLQQFKRRLDEHIKNIGQDF